MEYNSEKAQFLIIFIAKMLCVKLALVAILLSVGVNRLDAAPSGNAEETAPDSFSPTYTGTWSTYPWTSPVTTAPSSPRHKPVVSLEVNINGVPSPVHDQTLVAIILNILESNGVTTAAPTPTYPCIGCTEYTPTTGVTY